MFVKEMYEDFKANDPDCVVCYFNKADDLIAVSNTVSLSGEDYFTCYDKKIENSDVLILKSTVGCPAKLCKELFEDFRDSNPLAKACYINKRNELTEISNLAYYRDREYLSPSGTQKKGNVLIFV